MLKKNQLSKVVKIYGAGSGSSGLFFNESLMDFSNFKEIPISKLINLDIKDVLISGVRGYLISEDEEIFEYGIINPGKPGNVIFSPSKIELKIKLKKISCGWNHSIFLSDDGEIYGNGLSNNGEIPNGIQEKIFYERPVKIQIYDKNVSINDVFCGFRQTFLVCQNNLLLCSGYNKNRELGIFNKDICFSLEKNEFFMENADKIIKIETGQKFTCLLIGSKFYGWGDNKHGQLNNLNKKLDTCTLLKDNVMNFSLGWHHTLIFTNENELLMCGRGNFGQQGNKNFEDALSFHKVELPLKENEKIVETISGSEYCFCLTNCSIYSWGWNEHGNLGQNDTKNRSYPQELALPFEQIHNIKTAGAKTIFVIYNLMDIPKKSLKKIALLQMNSSSIQEENFNFISKMVSLAAQNYSQMVFLPENFNYIKTNDSSKTEFESLKGPTIQKYQDLAKKHKIWLSLGGYQEKLENSKKVYNSHLIIDNEGEIRSIYRKLHLFDIDVDENNRMRESATVEYGKEIIDPIDSPIGKIGSSICYDLRFPEIYRKLSILGSTSILIPSAFFKKTGEAHWEILLRCRAIENTSYVIAAAQTGKHGPKRESYGHSMVVDPWGKVVLDMGEEVGLGYADIDIELVKKVRERMPSLEHRRGDVYGNF